jgi:glycine cleavage system H protein
MNIPVDLKYSKEHEWVRHENDIVTVGITDYAQSQLGEIIFVDISPEIEKEFLDRNEPFGAIEAVKTVADIFMPVSGEIIEINMILNDLNSEVKRDSVINTDPYGAGWMIKVRISNVSELDELMDSEQYRNFID